MESALVAVAYKGAGTAVVEGAEAEEVVLPGHVLQEVLTHSGYGSALKVAVGAGGGCLRVGQQQKVGVVDGKAGWDGGSAVV